MSFVLSIEKGPHPGIARAEILRRLRKMIALLQLEKMEISFLLTDDERIWELNKVYRHKNRPTDVLAFAMQEGEFSALAAGMLGDVVVSVPTARRQASARKIDVLDEVTMLLAHGLLHLLGWDHDTPSKDRRMKAETERLCAAARPLEAPSRPKKKSGSSKGRGSRLLTRNQSSPSPAKKANKLATRVRGGARRPRKL